MTEPLVDQEHPDELAKDLVKFYFIPQEHASMIAKIILGREARMRDKIRSLVNSNARKVERIQHLMRFLGKTDAA